MGIPIIEELGNRLHRTAIAGTSLLKEDFRLKRAVEQLEKPAASNPVFKKMFELGNALICGTAEHPEEGLLDLITLVDAVLATQATAAVEGEVEPLLSEVEDCIFFEENGIPRKQYKYGELMPVYQALTTKGSGRYEVIETAYKEKNGVLRDIRLHNVLVGGLGDSYTEIITLVERILQELGKEILPALKKEFDPNGAQEMVRRISVIEKIAGKEENQFYLDTIEQGSGTVRQKAVYALCHDEQNIPKLIALADMERGNMKKTVLYTLGQFSDAHVDAYFKEYLKKHKEASAEYLVFNDSEAISDIVAEWMEQLIQLLDSGKKLLDQDEIKLVQLVCEGMINKTSQRIRDALEQLAGRLNKLASLRDKNEKLFSFSNIGNVIGTVENCMDVFLMQMTKTVIITNNQSYKELILKLYDQYGLPFLPAALLVLLREQPEQAYERIQPYLTGTKEQKGKKQILSALEYLSFNTEAHSYYLTCQVMAETGFKSYKTFKRKLDSTLDVRLFEIFMKSDRNYFHIVNGMLDENNEEQMAMCRQFLLEKARQGKESYLWDYLIKCKNTQWRGLFCTYLKNFENSQCWTILEKYKEVEVPIQEKIEELQEALELIQNGEIKNKNYKYFSIDDFKENIENYLQELKLQTGLSAANKEK